jgi:hypothetical protein
MKRGVLRLIIVFALMARAEAGTSLIYENFGNNDFGTTPPQIDALSFANYGFFGVNTLLPFDFQNTVNFTNKGTMSGNSGFRFDTASSFMPRRMAGNFINHAGATISSFDSGLLVLLIQGLGALTTYFPSYLQVSATNVVNQGLLSVGAGGLLELKARKMDLSRGGFEVRPIEGIGTGDDDTNFFPDIGINDVYWGGITNQLVNSSNLVRQLNPFFATVVTPPHVVSNIFFPTVVQFTMPVARAFVFTNFVTETNWIVQAAFVGLSDPAFSADCRFADSPIFTNDYKTPVVQISFTDTNLVSGGSLIQSLYMLDRLASWTNYNMLSNITVFPTTFRPANYQLSRLPFIEFITGAPPNSLLPPNLFYDTAYSNVVVTNLYSAYAAQVSAQPIQLQLVPGVSITNQPGRITVESEVLDVSNARFRGNTFVLFQTDHLISSSNAVVDAPNLSFSLASTNGNLKVQNISKDTVVRVGGFVRAWSGVWTNNIGVLVTNMVDDGMGGFTNQVVTNVVDIGFHVFALDASPLTTIQPVFVRDFVSRSTNVTLSDNMRVVDSFRVEAQSLTVDGAVSLESNARDWVQSTAPQLAFLTNNGTLTIQNNGFIGSDRPQPYEVIANRGVMTAASFYLAAKSLVNIGGISAQGQLGISALTASFEGGALSSGGDLFINANTVRYLNALTSVRGGLYLTVTNSLADAGSSANNRWSCSQGFHLLRKPLLGDLLGTEVRTRPLRFVNVLHTWAAEDRGASPAGYQNNAALGRLVLDSEPFGLLTFAGRDAGNALYVDFLELAGPVLANLESIVSIDSTLVIYFADSNVSAEQLDGSLGGRLRWARDFAGPNSSVDVLLLNGQTITVNRALRFSLTIDSDGDGVVNGLDAYPFDDSVWNPISLSMSGGQPAIALRWLAAGGAVVQIESTTNLARPDWQPLMNYTNLTLTNVVVSFLDTNSPANDSQRFYRFRYQP